MASACTSVTGGSFDEVATPRRVGGACPRLRRHGAVAWDVRPDRRRRWHRRAPPSHRRAVAGSSTRLTRTGATPTTSSWSAERCTEGANDAVVATKFGFRFPPDATPHLVPTTFSRRQVRGEHRAALRAAVRARQPGPTRNRAHRSLVPALPDPEVPIEDTVGAMADVVAEGLVAHIGLSNVTAEQLRRACAVHPVAAVQVEWSLWTPIDAELLAVAGEHDVGIVAWSPLGGGFLTGSVIAHRRGRLPHQLRSLLARAPREQQRAVRTTPSGGRGTRDHARASSPSPGSFTSIPPSCPSPAAADRHTSTRTWRRHPSSCRPPTWRQSTTPAPPSPRRVVRSCSDEPVHPAVEVVQRRFVAAEHELLVGARRSACA